MSKATKIAFGAYHETCPFVDAALNDLFESIKHIIELDNNQINGLKQVLKTAEAAIKTETNGLRTAFIDSVDELLIEIDKLKDKIYELESEE